MNKLIQTIVLTAVVCSPLSLLSLMASADAHHTSSHVSTLSMQTTIARKKKKNKVRTSKKRMTTSSSKKKPAAVDATTQPETGMPSGGDSPMKQPMPDTTMPNSKVKPIDPSVDSGITKPAPDLKVPPSGTVLPSVPTSIPSGMPSIPSVKPSLPNVPTGLPK